MLGSLLFPSFSFHSNGSNQEPEKSHKGVMGTLEALSCGSLHPARILGEEQQALSQQTEGAGPGWTFSGQ